MLIESYPVGIAFDVGKPEPFAVYLIDMPGVAMQGRTANEALDKLKAVVPAMLAKHHREGVALPQPSPEPALEIGEVRWVAGPGRDSVREDEVVGQGTPLLAAH